MKARTHRRIFWAAIVSGFLGICLFIKNESWGAFWLTACSTVIALFAGEAGDIYEEEGQL